MEWAALNEFIDPSLLIVVAACWALSYTAKQTPRVPEWSVAYIITLVAIAAVIALQGMTAQSVLQGVICGAVAVYGNRFIKQASGKITKQPQPVVMSTEKPAQPAEQPPKVEQAAKTEKLTGAKPAPAQPKEEPKVIKPLTQADISKHASVAAEFVVDDKGTVTVKGEIPLFTENATAVLLRAGIKELIFKADKQLHWIGVGADEAGDKMALIGIGSMNNNIANITASNKALAYKVGYTKSDLDESHKYTAGGTYKVVNNEQNIEVYYQKGDTFALWYRIAKTADVLNTGETMDWLTPRLGAIVGISDADHTNKSILVEAKLNDAGQNGKDTGGSL